jgi:signal transduction histidine kinase/CheY-like chemotaxis protein
LWSASVAWFALALLLLAAVAGVIAALVDYALHAPPHTAAPPGWVWLAGGLAAVATGGFILILRRLLPTGHLPLADFALRMERQEYVTLLAGFGLWEHDLEGGSFWCSPRYLELMDGMRGLRLPRDVDQEHCTSVQSACEALLRGERERLDTLFRRVGPDGAARWLRLRGFVVQSGPQRRRAVGMVEAVDLPIAASERSALAARGAGLDGRTALLYTMSHEMRTPLNGVLGAAALLEATGLSAEQARYVSAIQTSGEALLSVVSDVLDYSRIEAGRVELELRPFDWLALIEGVFEIVAARSRDKPLDLLCEVADDVPHYCLGDEGRLRQILLNLVANAVKFTPRGHVRATVTRQGEAPQGVPVDLCITVEDSGPGVPAAARDKLFQPFMQADPDNRQGGSGLGLAISQRLAGIMGGSLAYAPAADAGARFVLSLRLTPTEGRRTYTGPMASGQLLDELDVVLCAGLGPLAEHLCRMLGSWGCRVMRVASLEAAMQIPLSGAPLALVDLDLDDVASIRLAQALRQRWPQTGAPVVATSRHTPAQIAARAPDLDAWLTAQVMKPLARAQLFDALVKVLTQTHEGLIDEEFAHDTIYHVQQGGPYILVAEDNEINQTVVRGMLARLGHACDVVADGQAALEAVMRHRYRVVLMDVQMPRMSGREVSRRIVAALPEGKRPVIIALTAHALSEDREACLAAGMDDYLAKPLKLDQLRAALEGALERAARRAAGASRAPAIAPQRVGLLDGAQLEELLALDREAPGTGLIERILHRQSLRTREGLDNMVGWLASPDGSEIERIRHTAHDLRGLAGTVGASRLAEALHGVEEAARRDPAGLPTALAASDAVLGATEQALAAWLVAQNRKAGPGTRRSG